MNQVPSTRGAGVVVAGLAAATLALLAGCSGASTDTASPATTTTVAPATSAPTSAPATSSAPTSSAGSDGTSGTDGSGSASGGSGSSGPAGSGSGSSGGSGSSAGGAGGGGGGITLCTPSGSRFTIDDLPGFTGHFGIRIHVTNAADAPCVTTGYPGVTLLGSDGSRVLQADRTEYGVMGGNRALPDAPQITLQPGETATAIVEGTDVSTSCTPSPQLLVTLPDNTDAVTLDHSLQACDGLEVHPLLKGSSGANPST